MTATCRSSTEGESSSSPGEGKVLMLLAHRRQSHDTVSDTGILSDDNVIMACMSLRAAAFSAAA